MWKGYVVINYDELDGSVTRLMDEIKQDDELYNQFITPDDALSMIDRKITCYRC